MNKSILIPCFNEKHTILKIIEKVKQNLIEGDDIIIVDDYSNDGTRNLLKEINEKNIKILYHDKNSGKGKALKTALKE